jgi:transposase-like protein
MVSTPPCCPQCGSRRLIRYGIVAGKQRWRCRRCRYQFIRPDRHGTPEPTKRAAVSLYGYGLSFNAVAERYCQLGVDCDSFAQFSARVEGQKRKNRHRK